MNDVASSLWRRARSALRALRAWLAPGIGVKRWILVLVLGTLLVGLGLSVFLIELNRSNPNSLLLYWLTLRFLDRSIRAVVLIAGGGAAVGLSVLALSRALLAPFQVAGRPAAEAMAAFRRRERGPRIAAVGGGTGLSTLLRGLKHHSANITAIVTVADDGGSSGRLRRSLGIPPPGDLRNCLAALSDDESLLTQLFQYRFAEGGGLDGHSFGNLFVSALAGVTGNFEKGLLEAGRVLSIRGQVMPSTLRNVTLVGELVDAATSGLKRVEGESEIVAMPGAIWRVALNPEDVPAYPGAVQAILGADMVVVGPGSLFTSVIPNLLIREIREALRATTALRVYVCNLATQPGETDGFRVGDHLMALERHIGPSPFDMILVNSNTSFPLPEDVAWVSGTTAEVHGQVRALDLADSRLPGHHHPEKLAAALLAVLSSRRAPLRM
jgi:uncharacterized cofD-like protein